MDKLTFIKLLELFTSQDTRILFQNIGKDDYTLKMVITLLYDGLTSAFPPRNPNKDIYDMDRSFHIRKKMIYIVDSERIHTIWIHNGLNDASRVYSQEQCNVEYADPAKFNYWGLPSHYFDIIISNNPVRLDMLKECGLLIK